MSSEGGEKTEEPTQKKIDDSRKQGQVWKSRDFTGVLVFTMRGEVIQAVHVIGDPRKLDFLGSRPPPSAPPRLVSGPSSSARAKPPTRGSAADPADRWNVLPRHRICGQSTTPPIPASPSARPGRRWHAGHMAAAMAGRP